MSIHELDSAQKQRRAQLEHEQEEKKTARESYSRSVVIADSKIKDFIKVLQRERDYKDRSTGGVFIDLGSQTNLEELTEVAADFLGRKEKQEPAEHITVSAYKNDGRHRVRVNAGTNGTDRFIEVITVEPFIGSAAISVAFHLNNQLGAEPKTVHDAYEKGISSVAEQLSMGEKLVDFAINESIRVMTPPQGH